MRMARETKAARDAREAAERDAAERVWHKREGVWCRREGKWWIVLAKVRKSHSIETAWVASLRYGWGLGAGWICGSPHLCDVAGMEIGVACALADAWAVETTHDLVALVQPGPEVTP
jgi:hypothetical protein